MGMTFGQFSEANRARCESSQGFNHPLSGWSTSDWMTAMVGEVGEAANVVKKLNRYRDGVPGNKVSEAELRDQLRKELGDVFVYLDLMAQSLGFSIADAAARNWGTMPNSVWYRSRFFCISAFIKDWQRTELGAAECFIRQLIIASSPTYL
jgi:NTP pyrophosphatase (non-canonical NTP hydrolase)